MVEKKTEKKSLSFFSKVRIKITGFPWLKSCKWFAGFATVNIFVKWNCWCVWRKLNHSWPLYCDVCISTIVLGMPFLVTLSTQWYKVLFSKCVCFPVAFSFFGIQHSQLHSPENLEMLVHIHLATEGLVGVWETSEVIFRLWHLNISLQVQSKVYLFKLQRHQRLSPHLEKKLLPSFKKNSIWNKILHLKIEELKFRWSSLNVSNYLLDFFFLLLRDKTLKNNLRRGHEGESMDIIKQTFESWVWWYML